MPSLSLYVLAHFSVHCAAQAGDGMVFFGSLLPLSWLGQALEHATGWECGREAGREEGGRGGLGGGRLEGWRRGLQLVMKSSLFILRRQTVSERAWGLRCSAALSACNALPCAAQLSAAVSHSWDTQRECELKGTATVMRLSQVSALPLYF